MYLYETRGERGEKEKKRGKGKKKGKEEGKEEKEMLLYRGNISCVTIGAERHGGGRRPPRVSKRTLKTIINERKKCNWPLDPIADPDLGHITGIGYLEGVCRANMYRKQP